MILSTKKLKLNSLKNVDDKVELPENPFVIHQFDYTTTNLVINKNDYLYIPDEYVINDDFIFYQNFRYLSQ